VIGIVFVLDFVKYGIRSVVTCHTRQCAIPSVGTTDFADSVVNTTTKRRDRVGSQTPLIVAFKFNHGVSTTDVRWKCNSRYSFGLKNTLLKMEQVKARIDAANYYDKRKSRNNARPGTLTDNQCITAKCLSLGRRVSAWGQIIKTRNGTIRKTPDKESRD
jgi:hypothetical protein